MSTRTALDTLSTETLGATAPWLAGAHETYAQVASWAVWAPETVNGTQWSTDQTVLATDLLAPVAHARVVFLALNKGVNPAVDLDSDWANFHSGRADYKFARAISQADPSRTLLWGAYMTDLFKGLPTPTAADLDRHLEDLPPAEHRRTLGAMAALFERELEILGQPRPLVVGIGRTVQEWLPRLLPHHETIGITHYAAAVGRQEYADELQRVADRVSDRLRAGPSHEALVEAGRPYRGGRGWRDYTKARVDDDISDLVSLTFRPNPSD